MLFIRLHKSPIVPVLRSVFNQSFCLLLSHDIRTFFCFNMHQRHIFKPASSTNQQLLKQLPRVVHCLYPRYWQRFSKKSWNKVNRCSRKTNADSLPIGGALYSFKDKSLEGWIWDEMTLDWCVLLCGAMDGSCSNMITVHLGTDQTKTWAIIFYFLILALFALMCGIIRY